MTSTGQAHKYAAAAGSFCFVTTENGKQQDVCNLTPLPCVQRSLCLDEVMNDSSSAQVEVWTVKPRDLLERCMATCAKSSKSNGPRRDPVQERKHQLRR